MTIHPIDIDFAGWTIVPEGEHNAFASIIDDQIVAIGRTKEECAAQVDTHAERGDVKQAPSARMGSAVRKDAPSPDGQRMAHDKPL